MHESPKRLETYVYFNVHPKVFTKFKEEGASIIHHHAITIVTKCIFNLLFSYDTLITHHFITVLIVARHPASSIFCVLRLPASMEKDLIRLLNEEKWKEIKKLLVSKRTQVTSPVLRIAVKKNEVPLEIIRILLSSAKLKTQRMIFEYACANETKIEVKELILEEMNPSPSMAETLLLAAMKHENKDAINMIIEKIVLCLAPGFHTNTFIEDYIFQNLCELLMSPFVQNDLIFSSEALHAAASRGHNQLANFILGKFPGTLKIKDKDGNLPLHCACLCRNMDVASTLLRGGIETNQFKDGDVGGLLSLNKSKKSALRLTCGSGNDGARISQVATWLIDVNLDLFSNPNVIKEVQLAHLVARYGDLSTMNVLLEGCPLSIQWKDQFGSTPLSAAFEYGRFDLALVIYDTAKRHGNMNHFKLVKDAIFTALDREADPNLCVVFMADAGIDPLHMRETLLLHHVAGKGSPSNAALLIESYTFALTKRDTHGCLPIHWACRHHNTDMIQYLVTEACLIDEFQDLYGGLLAQSNEGEVPIHSLLAAFNEVDDNIFQISECIIACMESARSLPILHYAISKLDLESDMMKEFIEIFNPNPCTAWEGGKTALHSAIDACVYGADPEDRLNLLKIVMRYDRDYRWLHFGASSQTAQAVHYAVSLDFSWDPHVKMLAEGDFHSLSEPHDATGLLPFMLAATRPNCDLDIIYGLLRTDPSF